jgi:hypothetical protein
MCDLQSFGKPLPFHRHLLDILKLERVGNANKATIMAYTWRHCQNHSFPSSECIFSRLISCPHFPCEHVLIAGPGIEGQIDFALHTCISCGEKECIEVTSAPKHPIVDCKRLMPLYNAGYYVKFLGLGKNA